MVAGNRTLPPRLAFFGGNGHCEARLASVREVLDSRPDGPDFLPVSVPYPGFEGRPRARSREEFLDLIEGSAALAETPNAIHATGIGALIVLALRARGRLVGVPVVLEGPVLWGLETRRFPRLMRLPGVARLVGAFFQTRLVQRRFARRHFDADVSPRRIEEFFDGYRRCRAFADLFYWFTPACLRELEAAFAARPEALADIEIWWGGRDAVVGEAESQATERKLGVSWPVRRFPDWGHYPLLTDAAAWTEEVARGLARA
jgi:hypothetical protein